MKERAIHLPENLLGRPTVRAVLASGIPARGVVMLWYSLAALPDMEVVEPSPAFGLLLEDCGLSSADIEDLVSSGVLLRKELDEGQMHYHIPGLVGLNAHLAEGYETPQEKGGRRSVEARREKRQQGEVREQRRLYLTYSDLPAEYLSAPEKVQDHATYLIGRICEVTDRPPPSRSQTHPDLLRALCGHLDGAFHLPSFPDVAAVLPRLRRMHQDGELRGDAATATALFTLLADEIPAE